MYYQSTDYVKITLANQDEFISTIAFFVPNVKLLCTDLNYLVYVICVVLMCCVCSLCYFYMLCFCY